MPRPRIYPASATTRAEIKEYVTARFPETFVSCLGRSILSRPIDLYRIGQGKDSVLIVGAHHGAEHISASFVYGFMLSLLEADLTSGVYFGVSTREYFKRFSLLIVPALNPDGIEISLYGPSEGPLYERELKMIGDKDNRSWQANARGVDLNHNYSYGFYEYKNIEREKGIEPGHTLYSGEYPESEPETHALASLIRVINPDAVLSLHTQGEEIYAYPDTDRVYSIAQSLSRILGYKLSRAEGTARYGGLCDYTGAMGIRSFTLEIGRGTNPIPESELGRSEQKVSEALFRLPLLL